MKKIMLILVLSVGMLTNVHEPKGISVQRGDAIKDYLEEQETKNTEDIEYDYSALYDLKIQLESSGIPDYYSGVFFDEQGVVEVNTTDEMAMESWLDRLDHSYRINKVAYSMDELQDAYNCVIDYAVGEKNSILDSHITGMYIDEKHNKIVIKIDDVDDESIERYKSIFNAATLPDDILSFVYETEIYPSSGTIKAGYHLTTSTGTHFSAGYRARWTNAEGTTYYGFVTASHAMANNLLVYDTAGSTIGLCMTQLKSGSAGVDAAFIRIIGNGYTVSNQVMYSNSIGNTSGGVTLGASSWMVSFTQGAQIYKSGYASYLTQGTITNTSNSYQIFNGQFYNDLLESAAYVASGDSGGACFYYYDGGYVKAGIVIGATYNPVDGSFSKSFYVKADNIYEALSVVPY